MPHLIFETTPEFSRSIDFPVLMRTIHEQLVTRGYAVLVDLKSRMHAAEHYLIGDDLTTQFLVIRLILTKSRDKQTQQAMGQLVHDIARDAIEKIGLSVGWQCSVLVIDSSRAPYIKTLWTGMDAAPGSAGSERPV